MKLRNQNPKKYEFQAKRCYVKTQPTLVLCCSRKLCCLSHVRKCLFWLVASAAAHMRDRRINNWFCKFLFLFCPFCFFQILIIVWWSFQANERQGLVGSATVQQHIEKTSLDIFSRMLPVCQCAIVIGFKSQVRFIRRSKISANQFRLEILWSHQTK